MYENEIIIGSLKGEIWKPIPDYPGYLASTEGRIYSRKKNKILLLDYSRRYTYIQLTDSKQPKGLRLHRIIASVFCTKPDNATIVHHIDKNPRNNRPNNLQWLTEQQHKTIHSQERELNKKGD